MTRALTHGPANRLPRPTDHRQTTTTDLLLERRLRVLGMRLQLDAALMSILVKLMDDMELMYQEAA